MDLLKNLDEKLFLWINNHHSSITDFIFYWASDRWIWLPFYFFLAFIFYRKTGWQLWKILLAAGILILLSDQLSVLIKDAVQRYRPCHNLLLQSKIILVNKQCGGMYGFVSSHAANSMALTAFLIFAGGKIIKWLPALMISWCLLVSYSRIYLGSHYPLDIAGGWLLGILLACIVFYFYKKYLEPV